jgi:hypothetical protein
MRPARLGRHEKTYGEILEERGHRVRNACKAGVMINEAFGYIDDEVISFYPDAVIFHFGIVEICRRRTIRFLNNLAVRNYYRNNVFVHEYRDDTIIEKINHFVIRAVRKIQTEFAKLFHADWQWLNEKRFIKILEESINIIRRETGAKAIIIGCSPCDERVNRILPGSQSAVVSVNSSMKELAEAEPENIVFIDPVEFVNKDNIAEMIPDGIHFSSKGQTLISELLLQALEKFNFSDDKSLDVVNEDKKDSVQEVLLYS